MAKVHKFQGVAYSENRTYRDRYGDDWSFTGEGTQMSDGTGAEEEAPLSYVVDMFGPLHPVD